MLEGKPARVLDLLAADGHHRAVGQHDLQSAHIVARDAVLYRPHPAGVGADVAADARRLFAGVRWVKQAAPLHIGLHIPQKDARLDGDGHSVLVQLQHTVHAGEVEDDAAEKRHGRADQIRSRAARRDRNAVFVGIAQHAADLLRRERKDQRVRRALQPPQRVAAVFSRNGVAEEQAFGVRDQLPKSGFVNFHGYSSLSAGPPRLPTAGSHRRSAHFTCSADPDSSRRR